MCPDPKLQAEIQSVLSPVHKGQWSPLSLVHCLTQRTKPLCENATRALNHPQVNSILSGLLAFPRSLHTYHLFTPCCLHSILNEMQWYFQV